MELTSSREQTTPRNPGIVLASGSPRRRELLGRLGLPFEVVVSNEPEPLDLDLPPERLAMHLAEQKARAVARGVARGLVIGADTLLSLHGAVIGKPADDADAVEILTRLSGRSHEVWTGLAIIDAASGRIERAAVPSVVRFQPLSAERIAEYVATGEGRDKAGAYAVQGEGGALIAAVIGCYNNVVGLPLCEVSHLLARYGVAVPVPAPVCTRPDGSACPRLIHDQ